jgi:hypothetical protein
MIARHPYRTTPIPFSNNALVFQPPSTGNGSTALLASEPKRSPWGTTIAQLSQAHGAPGTTHRSARGNSTTSSGSGTTSPLKATRARYDGPHALSIRSATSGRHYRFEHPGAEQVIDTIDIALLRRIEGITII